MCCSVLPRIHTKKTYQNKKKWRRTWMSNEQQKSSHVLDMRRRIATHCNTLKHTATNWNTFQYAWALQNACRLDIVCLQSHCVTVFVHTLITTLKSPQQKWYSYASHVQAYCYDSTACWACAQVVVCVYKHENSVVIWKWQSKTHVHEVSRGVKGKGIIWM